MSKLNERRPISSAITRFPPRPFTQSQTRLQRVAGFTVAVPDYRDLYRNLVETICSIGRPTLKDGEEVDTKITDFKAVAAYNWDDKTEPRIIVPGKRHLKV